MVSGASQLVLDGSSFLKSVININLTGSNQVVGSVTMQNGDVDNSGEVDAADIDAVIGDFEFRCEPSSQGRTGPSRLNPRSIQ